MLNAFRHQRKKRSNLADATPVTTSCSTPSGIKGRNAAGVRRDFRQHGGMLNAFRHQRKKRYSSWSSMVRSRACSTPSGIKGRNAFWYEFTPQQKKICSTPSGIKGRNARILPAGQRASFDAQRLPASKEETRACGTRRRPEARMLNAFRHQRKKRRQWREKNDYGSQMLNAFRHQRKKRRLPGGRDVERA